MHWSKIYNLMFWDENLCKCQLCLFGLMCHLRPMFIDFLFRYLSRAVIGVFRSPTMIVFLLVSPLISVSSCYIYFGASWVGAYILRSVLSPWYIVTFIIIKYPSLSLVTFLEIYFVRYTYGCPWYSVDAICLENVFPPFHFESVFVFTAKMCLLKAAYGRVLFFDPICYFVLNYWWTQFIFIVGNYWCMRVSYSYFTFCFLVAVCLHWFFSFVFLSVVLVWWYCILFPSVSWIFLKLYDSILEFSFCVWLPLGLQKRKFYIYSHPFSFECI